MKFFVKKSHVFAIFILFGVGFACIAPTFDWYGMEHLKPLATENSKEFYTKLFDGKYHEIYIEADDELKTTISEDIFVIKLKAFMSKLKSTPDFEGFECNRTKGASLWDRIKINNGFTGLLKSSCGVYPYKAFENQAYIAHFVWRQQNNSLKLVSFVEETIKY